MVRIFILFLLGLTISLSFVTGSQADQQVSQDQQIQQQIAQQQENQLRRKELNQIDQKQLQQLSEPNQYLFDGEYDSQRDADYYSRRGLESRREANYYYGRGEER